MQLTYPVAIGDEATLTKPEWLAVRHTGIGGSDAAAIFGKSPWKSTYALWTEKVREEPPAPLPATQAMAFGTQMEPHLRTLFAEVTNLTVIEDTTIYAHPEHDWMLANLDGVVLDDFTGEPVAVLEIKTASQPQKWANGVPEHYRLQVVHYLAVTGLAKGYVGVLLRGEEFRTYEVQRDEAEITHLIATEERFWHSVLEHREPEVDGSDSTKAALLDTYPTSDGEVDLDPTVIELIERRAGLKRDADAVAEEIKAIDAAIMRMLGDAEVGKVDDRKVVTWKTQQRSTIDSKRLKAEMPEVAEQFSKTSSTRVLRIMDLGGEA